MYVVAPIHSDFDSYSDVDIEAEVPSAPEGTSLAVRCPDGSHVAPCGEEGAELPAVLEFTSSRPVSLSGHLIFRDTHSGKK